MKFKIINHSIFILVLLASCSTLTPAPKTTASASEQNKTQQGQMLPITATARIGEEEIQLEVARTPEQQAIGLMYRESLADNRGMLFPFQQERYARFWMKNVPIALDIIFLNDDRIVDIAANVPGCQTEPCPIYGPQALVNRVIELRGGKAAELGVKVNDTISVHSLDSN